MSDLICGAGAFVATFSVTNSATENWGMSLLVSILSAIIFAFLNIGTKILTSYLEKKGVISSKHKKMIDDTADDLADDGKINGSNKETKLDDEEGDDIK